MPAPKIIARRFIAGIVERMDNACGNPTNQMEEFDLEEWHFLSFSAQVDATGGIGEFIIFTCFSAELYL